ncbi:AGE family epimerase/isomerase [Herbaspirillum sp. LeCh32-8]|uniref:AGE family epimerase/isomerase n=1 Tax=Herbaspirillum sp. LeCh32-8 TaxID=2821356 RepID=UPI001AE4D724|nr:AGE family epimerase/isomerase [Herbaspirillum sp. LeCh32-8]MBP0598813.1 AGE family epimerase/isomerase [Herbaspirillum sp. LeCh32-8]
MTLPDFESRRVLQAHVARTLAFYDRHAIDPQGGFFHYLKDDGSVYNRTHRHLVSATRLVFTQAMAFTHTGQARYREQAQHALAHLQRFEHRDGPLAGLFAWTLEEGRIEDGTVMAYGQAFVLLAYAHAHRIGLCEADRVAQAFERMNDAFYEAPHGAYADEITPAGALIDYRGQNANMHMCEACLAAYEATRETRYLQRAQELIETFVFGFAAHTSDLVWEHYGRDWSVDWDYNRGNPDNIFKPWGFQTGHQTEWAKLLMIADGYAPERRYVERAATLQRLAWRHGWDVQHGGLIYGFDPDFRPYDSHKYFWVQAESFASAWRLWRATGEEDFRLQYHEIWAWSWRHLVDHEHGAWFRILAADGGKLEDTKSPAGKVDYHTMGACWDVLDVGGLAD